MPALYQHFFDIDLPDTYWMTKWHLSLFLYNFPIKIVRRIWDFFLTEGIFAMAYIVVPILKVFEQEFLKMEALQILEYV